MITKIDDIYDERKINFYFILFKYLFKNTFYIYNIPFLFQSRNLFLNILNREKNKFSEINKDIIKDMRKKTDFVINKFCDSKYYYQIYLGQKYEQLKHILKYYKNYLFNSKKNEIKLLEEFINNLNIEIDYEKYLEDSEKAKKSNARYSIIRYLGIENKKNLKDENEMSGCVQKWEELEKLIKDKKYRKMKRDNKESLKKYFIDIKNKDILLKIFEKDIYEYVMKEIINESKIYDNNNIEVNNVENNIKEEESNKINSKIEIEKEEIEYNSSYSKEIDKTLNVISDNSICNQNSKNNLNIKNKNQSKISIIYDSEKENDSLFFNESDFHLLEYLNNIGTHGYSAEFITEINNGYLVSGGGDKNLFLYNKEYQKILEIVNEDLVSSVLEIENDDNTKFSNEYIELLACTKKGIKLITIDKEEFDLNISELKECYISSPNFCLPINKFNNNYLITEFNGIYFASDLLSRILNSKIYKQNDIAYKGGIIINEAIVALTSNKIVNGGQNQLSFYNTYSKKIITKIQGYSFVSSMNGLALIPNEDVHSDNKYLLCACKKFESNQKNGILLVNIQFTQNLKINHTFYNTGDYEVYCFCPIRIKSKKDREKIFADNIKLNSTDYFFVGGYEKKKGKGIIKLYKLIKDQNIEFIQDIEIEKKKTFKGFKGPISCIIQSKKNEQILVSCWDGNVYLFSRPNLEALIKYEEKTKYDCAALMLEEESNEIMVEI